MCEYSGKSRLKIISEKFIECKGDEAKKKDKFRENMRQEKPTDDEVCYKACVQSNSGERNDFLVLEKFGFDLSYLSELSQIEQMENFISEVGKHFKCRPYGSIALDLSHFKVKYSKLL